MTPTDIARALTVVRMTYPAVEFEARAFAIVDAAIISAICREREACAKAAETEPPASLMPEDVGEQIAHAIRARASVADEPPPTAMAAPSPSPGTAAGAR